MADRKVKLRCVRCGSNAVVKEDDGKYRCLYCGAEGEKR